MYEFGVFSGSSWVDEETGEKFYKVRNSWGPDYGESGYIRVIRSDDTNTSTNCSVDNDWVYMDQVLMPFLYFAMQQRIFLGASFRLTNLSRGKVHHPVQQEAVLLCNHQELPVVGLDARILQTWDQSLFTSTVMDFILATKLSLDVIGPLWSWTLQLHMDSKMSS